MTRLATVDRAAASSSFGPIASRYLSKGIYMDIISVVVTLGLFALLLLAIVKKYNILTTLTLLTIVGYACATVMTGVSVLGEDGSGNMWLDIFEAYKNSISSTLAANGFLIMVVMAYSEYMNKIKASDMFAGLAAIPLTKIKSKFLLTVLSPIVGVLVLIIIPSGMSAFVVSLSTIYPILVAVGVRPLVAALGLLFGCGSFVGPANPFVTMAIDLSGTNVTVADFFFQYGLPMSLLLSLVVGIALALWSSVLDKKEVEEAQKAAEVKELDVKGLGVPRAYALLPLIPLVIIVVFSSFGPGNATISVVAAYTIGLFCSGLIHFFVSKKGQRKEAYNEIGPEFYNGAGSAFGRVVAIVALGTVFGSAITALGGIKIIMSFLVGSLGFGFAAMMVICAILYFIMMIFAGATLPIPLIIPAIVVVMESTGNMALLPVVIMVLVMGAGYGQRLQPHAATNLLAAQMHDVDPLVVVKYACVPAFAGLVFAFAFGFLLFA